ncbi:hypothetical protein [Caballeronia sp. dw_19]|uniref:hypothetical protein n=1 Tax=Caballeronia sp. dw_19 TaxID=2719791 RepID=UPI001BCDB03B|nr:hypothetical protein [Caballeronia sp. dw_19]
MNAIAEFNAVITGLPSVGDRFEGGFFNGLYVHGGLLKAQISASKVEGGHHARIVWSDSYEPVDSACDFIDGALGTEAMARAGSKLAQWAMDLRIGGHDDWRLPALQQLERVYRTAKPTADKNWQGNCGANPSSWPPANVYTADFPARTVLPLFLPGNAEAFDPIGMWSATQHPGYPSFAYVQSFDGGYRDWVRKGSEFGAVAVRSLILCPFDYSALVTQEAA